MNVTIGLWPLITTLAGWLFLFLGFAFAAGKILLAQIQKNLAERFETMEKAETAREKTRDDRFGKLEAELKEAVAASARVERDLLNLKAELPVNYTMRPDWVRGQSIIEAKLDALFNEVKQVRIEGAKHD
jgi:hypothetical protein